MSWVSDILTVLDRWRGWTKVREMPAKLATLEQRVSELEERLKRAPGDACPSCGALEFRVEKSVPTRNDGFAELGNRDHHYKCKECGFTDIRMKPGGQP